MPGTTNGPSQSTDSPQQKPAPVPVQRSDSAQSAHRRFMQRSKW